jgi:hypothetical protein
MSKVNAEKGKFKGYALVRNSAGQPQFNDYEDIPEVFHAALTEEDWIYINSKRKDS